MCYLLQPEAGFGADIGIQSTFYLNYSLFCLLFRLCRNGKVYAYKMSCIWSSTRCSGTSSYHYYGLTSKWIHAMNSKCFLGYCGHYKSIKNAWRRSSCCSRHTPTCRILTTRLRYGRKRIFQSKEAYRKCAKVWFTSCRRYQSLRVFQITIHL